MHNYDVEEYLNDPAGLGLTSLESGKRKK